MEAIVQDELGGCRRDFEMDAVVGLGEHVSAYELRVPKRRSRKVNRDRSLMTRADMECKNLYIENK